MSRFFSKLVDDLSAGDIASLQDQPEGQTFDIKQDLPTPKGNGLDEWHRRPQAGKSRSGPSDYAKEGLFAELVAFANAEGGWLVIGLKETKDKPPRVASPEPIPDCHELAERLERAAQDWIDPPVPSLRCRGIEIGGRSCAGIVVCRVPRSPLAPHRLNKSRRTQEAYKRVGEESKRMSMREIQDLTVDRARGQARIETMFEDAHGRYAGLVPEGSEFKRLLGFHIIAVPRSDPLVIDRPYLTEKFFERRSAFNGMRLGHKQWAIGTIDANVAGRRSGIRPILRGGQATWIASYSGGPNFQKTQYHEDLIRVEVFENGAVSLVVRTTNIGDDHTMAGLSVKWVIAELANALRIVDLARRSASSADAEYALEIELRYDIQRLGQPLEPVSEQFRFGLLDEENYFSKLIGPGPVSLPRYAIARTETFPNILRTVMDDLYNNVHKPHLADLEFDPVDTWL